MRVFNKIMDTCMLALAGVAGLALGFLLLAICFATFSRFAFNNPMSNLTEYSAYCLLYITFLGSPLLLQKRKHINVDIIWMAVKPRVKMVLVVFTDFLGAIISAVICYFSARITISNFVNDIRIMDSMHTPQWLLIIVIPVGALFMMIQFLRNAKEDVDTYKQLKAGDK